MSLTVKHINKWFGQFQAIKDLSMEVQEGAIFGFLGANGAGKTTTMRMILDILRPDSGSITWNGRDVRELPRRNLGYLPEERGLYPRRVLEEQLLFMAEIKGVRRADAARRLPAWFERLGLLEWRRRKVNELSKGMQQKAQLIATLLHDPEVLILDEPMSGLDPVGADVVGAVLLEMRREGKTVVLSSHQMETVERLCDRVALINGGQKVLDGAVSEVKARYGKNTVALAFEGDGAFIETLPGVAKVTGAGQYLEVRLKEGADPQLLLQEASQRLRLRRFEIVEPSLHDIVVETVTSHDKEAA